MPEELAELSCALRLTVDLSPHYSEPSDHILHFEGEVLTGENYDQRAGTISLYVVDLLGAQDEGHGPWEVLDSLNASLARFWAVVTPRTGLYTKAIRQLAGEALGSLLVVDLIELQPAYRGQGLGLTAIDVACRRFRTSCGVALLRAFPTQWEGRVAEGAAEFRRDRAKLIAHYERAGFRRVLGDGIMARGLG